KGPAEEEPCEELGEPPTPTPPHARGGDLLPAPLPEVVVPTFDAAGVCHPELHAGCEPFPHPWDTEEERRLDLAQVVREGLAPFAEVHDVTGPHGHDHGDQALGDVAEREVGQDLVVTPGAVEAGCRLGR